MRLVFVLALLGTVVYHADGFLGEPPVRDTGLLASIFTSFTQTDELGVPIDLDYAFILARHGMVVPVERSYPEDIRWQTKWKKGVLTTHARRMMTKLGRSLKTRYRSFINTVTLKKVYVSTMDTEYGYDNAMEVLRGLCDGAARPLTERRPEIDKFDLLRSHHHCAAYSKLRIDTEQYAKLGDDELHLFYYLRRSIGDTKQKSSPWYIDSRERVYNLWEIIDFELKSKEWDPLWYGEDTKRTMRQTVNKFLDDSTFGHEEMAQYVVGPLFQAMLDGYLNRKANLHLHITNDFTYAAFKSILLDRGIRAPEFGETLMVEVDTNGDVRVYTYKPYRYWFNYYQNVFNNGKDITSKMSIIRERIAGDYRFGVDLHDLEWRRRCNGMPPTNLGGYRVSTRSRQPRFGMGYSSGAEEEDYRSRGRTDSRYEVLPESSSRRPSTPIRSEPEYESSQSRKILDSPSKGYRDRPYYEGPTRRSDTPAYDGQIRRSDTPYYEGQVRRSDTPAYDDRVRRSDTPVTYDYVAQSSRNGRESEYPIHGKAAYWDQPQHERDIPRGNGGRDIPRSFSGPDDKTSALTSRSARLPASVTPFTQTRTSVNFKEFPVTDHNSPRRYREEPRVAPQSGGVTVTYPSNY